MSLERLEGRERAAVVSRLKATIEELKVAAIPTKCEVFAICGRPARQLADDNAALIGEAGDV